MWWLGVLGAMLAALRAMDRGAPSATGGNRYVISMLIDGDV